MKKLIILLFLLGISACASYQSMNRTTKSEVIFRGGVAGDRAWDDELVFKRSSWYRGVTLAYDLHLAELKSGDPFTYWLSPGDKAVFDSCPRMYIGLLYASSLGPSSLGLIRNELEESGFEEQILPSIVRNIKAHYAYKSWNMYSYKITGFCQSSATFNNKKVFVTIPGFSKIEVLHQK